MTEKENDALAFVRWIQELVNSYDADLKAINQYIKAQALKIENLEKINTEQQIKIDKLENTVGHIEEFLSRKYK